MHLNFSYFDTSRICQQIPVFLRKRDLGPVRLLSEDLTCYFALQLPPTERESLFRSSALRVRPDVDFGLDV